MNKNFYLIISDNKQIIDFNLQNILKKIKYEETSKITYDLSIDKFSDILDEASTLNMFGDTKVIIGNNFDLDKITDNDIDYLTKYIDNYNKNNYIIIIANKFDLRKKASKLFKEKFNVLDTGELKNDNVFDYIKSLIKEKKYKMTDNDIEYFISKAGTDINNINNELEKLFIYKEKDKEINYNDIELLVIENIDTIMYEFTNAILDKDYNKITVMYEEFKRQNVSPDYLIVSIAGSIRTSLTIKLLNRAGKTNADIAKIIGKKEFFVKKSLERLYVYDIDTLVNYLNRLAIIDRNLKTGKTNIDELELFLLQE